MNIVNYYPIAKEYQLSEKIVIFKRLPNREPIYPFQQYKPKLNEENELQYDVKGKLLIYTPDW